MWYKHAQQEIWGGIKWSGPFGSLLKEYVPESIIRNLRLDKEPLVWSVVVSDEELFDVISNSIHFSNRSHIDTDGIFFDFTQFDDDEISNLSAIGDLVNCEDLGNYHGMVLIKENRLDSATLVHEATHANRYRRSIDMNYASSKEEIEASINEGLVERYFEEEGLPLSEVRENEIVSAYGSLSSGGSISDVLLRNMLIRYIVKYSNEISFDAKYLNRLAMRIRIFFNSMRTFDRFPDILLSLMEGDLDPDEMLSNYENVLHDKLFSGLTDRSFSIKRLRLDMYGELEIQEIFNDLIGDGYDGLEHGDYELVYRILNMLDDLLINLKSYDLSDFEGSIDELDTGLSGFVPSGEEVEYPENPSERYKDFQNSNDFPKKELNLNAVSE